MSDALRTFESVHRWQAQRDACPTASAATEKARPVFQPYTGALAQGAVVDRWASVPVCLRVSCLCPPCMCVLCVFELTVCFGALTRFRKAGVFIPLFFGRVYRQLRSSHCG